MTDKCKQENVKKDSSVEDAISKQYAPPKITISFQDALLQFFQTLPKAESVILIDIKKTQECCLFGAEVEIKVLKKMPKEEIISEEIEVPELTGRSFYISKEFTQFFSKYTHLRLELQGTFRKRIVCSNIPPYITKVCGV